MPVTIEHKGSVIETNARFDPGSSATLILDEMSRKFNIEGKTRPLTIAWTNGNTQEEIQSSEVELRIKGTNGKRFLLKEVGTVQKLSLPQQTVDFANIKKAYPYL